MLAEEQRWLEEQVSAGDPEPNDSGFLAVDYFTKRVRYSHVIYLVSLLDTVLDEACRKLVALLGEDRIPFALNDLHGDRWSKRKKFLERYGHFEMPTEAWGDILVLDLVRNAIVHENGGPVSLQEHERARLLAADGVTITNEALEIGPTYVYGAIRMVADVTRFLSTQLGAIARRATRPELYG
jgi:hypothetical protein